MGATVEQLDEWRYAILCALYDESGGDELRWANLEDIAERVGVPKEQRRPAWQWLLGEGLIKPARMGPTMPVWITHAGIAEVDASKRNPRSPTEHFTPEVIRSVTNHITINAPVGSGQTGDHNTAHVTQHLNSEVHTLVQQLRQHVAELPEEKRAEAADVVASIEREAMSPTPKVGVIKALGAGLSALAADVTREGILKVVGELASKVGAQLGEQAGKLLP